MEVIHREYKSVEMDNPRSSFVACACCRSGEEEAWHIKALVPGNAKPQVKRRVKAYRLKRALLV